MGKMVDREYLDIGGLEFSCESLSQNHDKGGKTVNAMTRTGKPLGRASGNRTTEITADIAVRVEDIDKLYKLDTWWEDDTEVPVTIEQENGVVTSYEAGIIDSLSDTSSNGEEVKRSVTLTAWGRSIS